jgi:transcriptional regulator with XRE-family HTH domain
MTLWQLRKQLGITQDELVEQSGVAKTIVILAENGFMSEETERALKSFFAVPKIDPPVFGRLDSDYVKSMQAKSNVLSDDLKQMEPDESYITPDLIEHEAERLWQYLHGNLPHLVYKALLDKMNNANRIFLERAKTAKLEETICSA